MPKANSCYPHSSRVVDVKFAFYSHKIRCLYKNGKLNVQKLRLSGIMSIFRQWNTVIGHQSQTVTTSVHNTQTHIYTHGDRDSHHRQLWTRWICEVTRQTNKKLAKAYTHTHIHMSVLELVIKGTEVTPTFSLMTTSKVCVYIP